MATQSTVRLALLVLLTCSLTGAATVTEEKAARLENKTAEKHSKREEKQDKQQEHKEENARESERAGKEAANAVEKIEELRRSFKRNTTKEVVVERINEFAKSTAKAAGDPLTELIHQFDGNASVARRATAAAQANAKNITNESKAAHHRAREEAKSALSKMRHLDVQIKHAERKHVDAVRRDFEELSSMARKQARHAENEGERLVRLVRRRGDRLDELARKEGKNSEANRFERKADDAMRGLESEVDVGARRTDDQVKDLVNHLTEDINAKVQTRQEARERNISAVAESLLAIADQHQQLAETSTITTAAPAAFAGALVGGLAVTLAMGAVTKRRGGVQLQEVLLA